ncbi:Na+/H+ antiporter NhaA [Rhizobium tumorigenes]|uniref:Na+/H+ antiporter NhaA n=1 Tax=Rhizobium tumorigenes TaxID=2041385 RepID=UPI00241DBA5B|nr:Na+/H+ antiporter NhaA [Rhizobium tumorigenes]WFR99429.1 Na+/H+ antiporter NhaA [Rhizobium tumorigenes]
MKTAKKSKFPIRSMSFVRHFLQSSSAGGIVLMASAVVALAVANSPLYPVYADTLHLYVGGLSILHWVNDGLMAIFFLMVGMEIKREVLDGQLSTWSRRILPGVAAIGGMLVPALIYLSFNLGEAGHPKGWAIPSATDIAFALGVLSLLGPAVPTSLRVFLTALAIIDDLGAVLIIAAFYTGDLNVYALGGAAVTLLALVALNRAGVTRLLPYLVLGVILWFLTLQSGIHATLAGVALAFTIPLRGIAMKTDTEASPLLTLEHGIQPWVNFLIVPIFGFANAGVSFAGLSLGAFVDPVPLGVATGLFLGKQLGVFAFSAAVIRMGWAELPRHATWLQLYGVALLCGIGFTMSLFIGLLAFASDPMLQDETKLGVLLGSFLSAIVGAILLRTTGNNDTQPDRSPSA